MGGWGGWRWLCSSEGVTALLLFTRKSQVHFKTDSLIEGGWEEKSLGFFLFFSFFFNFELLGVVNPGPVYDRKPYR